MAERALIEMERKLQAGREYAVALKKLGFNPTSLLWAGVSGGKASAGVDMELLIISSWVDEVGPKAIYDVLFEAYDASVTPKEVDPFVVSLFSPRTQVAEDIQGALRTIRLKPDADYSGTMFSLGALDYFTIRDWIISHRSAKSNHFDDLRRFHAFQTKVAQLAA